MRLDELSRWQIPAVLIERWRKRQGEKLLPVQQRAIKAGLLGGDQTERVMNDSPNMIIAAPTSAGKSFCAELAAARALSRRQRVLLLFPLKALAEEMYERLTQTFGPLGVRCLIATSDYPANDRPFARGEYQIAVSIYEKADLLLTRSLDTVKTIGLIVVDEIQTIGEPGRGACLERLLTKIQASAYKPTVIALSAVLGEDNRSTRRLADWLEAVVINESRRPVELLRGVATEGSFRFKAYNSGDEGNEPWAAAVSDEPDEQLLGQLRQTTDSTLIFLKGRQDTVNGALALAAQVNWPKAQCAISALEGEEPSSLIRTLRQTLSRGVAFHNADLAAPQRKIIEKAFVDKEVKVLFSTTTLAMGVNLAADTVYLETVKYSNGRYRERPSLVPVSRAEFDNMTGRAGRWQAGREETVGRAVVLAQSEFDRDILWDHYIAAEQSEELCSVFQSLPLADWLLDMVVAGLLRSTDYEALTALAGRSFYAFGDNEPISPTAFEKALDELSDAGLVAVTADSLLRPTPIGEAAAGCGLRVQQVGEIHRRSLDSYPQSMTGWLALAVAVMPQSAGAGILSRWEYKQRLPLTMLAQCDTVSRYDLMPLLGEMADHEIVEYRTLAKLKGLLLMEQWRSLVPIQELEERFRQHLGQINQLGDSLAHLLYAFAALVTVKEPSGKTADRLRRLAFSLRQGMPVELQLLHEFCGDLLTRTDYGALVKAGLTTVERLCAAPEEQLSQLVRGKAKLMRLNEKIEQLKEEVHMEPRVMGNAGVTGQLNPAIFLEPEMIEIDGTYERERYLVKINGFPVRLTGKSFKYFTKLAWSRLMGESGWIYKEDIEQGFNQARYLYRMKGEIAQGLNADWSIYENNRLGYYRLNADPAKIRINFDNLKDHPDYELRELVASRTSGAVN